MKNSRTHQGLIDYGWRSRLACALIDGRAPDRRRAIGRILVGSDSQAELELLKKIGGWSF